MSTKSSSLLVKAQLIPLVALAGYLVFALSLLHPGLQRHFIFLHRLNYPFSPDFNAPEKYGIAPGKARNLRLTTSDGVSIGAWHILPDAYHRAHQPSPLSNSSPISEGDYDQAIKERPTVIYLHGNAANRAAPFRTASYAQFTARLQANVLAIDYRGFGDSEGRPSEEGLILDAQAAWDWVQARRGDQDVLVVGQSLGTGVGSRIVERLTKAGQPPQALVLIAPYLSLRRLVAEYRIGGIIPILAPALYIPFANQLLDWGLKTTFASDRALPSLYATLSASSKHGSPQQWPHLIISHATDDEVIPYSHGELLFDTILRSDVGRRVKTTTINGWARIEQFQVGGVGPSVTLVRTESGGHNTVGEGIVDIVRDVVGLDSASKQE
ncbi:alpha/beta-hydrolase [Jaminaea rosea]|uniref:Alpha/beta-hydrolase n=1 Tax=Jaminaea rosea TaxID=1569628 RepID=A0A316UPH1_9BASI|nr:alpha/beta-hydrolase [Jaminaea rosea]PWN26668.1 alpha/beta-hydrolase [Jaminaea rosea]